MYVYTTFCICCRANIWSNFFHYSRLSRFSRHYFSNFCVFVQNPPTGRMRCWQTNARNGIFNWPNSWANIRSIIGPDIGAICLIILAIFAVLTKKSNGKLFVNTIAMTEKNEIFLRFYAVLGFCHAQILRGCFLLGKNKPSKSEIKKKQTDKKGEPENKIQTSKQSSLVFLKKEDNTCRKHSNFMNQKAKANKKRNQSRIEKKLNPHYTKKKKTQELQGKLRSCSQAESKTRDTTQMTEKQKWKPQNNKKHTHTHKRTNKAKTKKTENNGRVGWGGALWAPQRAPPYPKPSKESQTYQRKTRVLAQLQLYQRHNKRTTKPFHKMHRTHEHHTTNHPKPNMQQNIQTPQHLSHFETQPTIFDKFSVIGQLTPFFLQLRSLLKTLSQ